MLGPLKFIAYTEDLPIVIEKHDVDHHLYADDGQLSDDPPVTDVVEALRNIENCVTAVHRWCASKRLQLNPTKTEIIWFGTKSKLLKLQNIDINLHVGTDIIKPVNFVCDLGVILDNELSMVHHINKTARICFHHLRRLKQVLRVLGPDITARLVSAYIFSRMDYCNSVLAGLPKSTIAPLQRVQNAAARLIKSLGPRDHITDVNRELHWLPVQYRIIYKLCLMMHSAHNGRGPRYIQQLLTATSSLSARSRLRSSDGNSYLVPRTRLKFGERAFSVAGPTAWNSLPDKLTRVVDSKKFKVELKTHLCTLAFANN